jgi:hypothetical protein
MVMSVGFNNLKVFGQFRCPALCDRSHHQSLRLVLLLNEVSDIHLANCDLFTEHIILVMNEYRVLVFIHVSG